MGHAEVYDLLSKTLENEKNTDVALTKIAESFVNQEAIAE
jgi:ferritin-like metal-binding protein YciE